MNQDTEIMPSHGETPLLCLDADPTPKWYICHYTQELCSNPKGCEWFSCDIWSRIHYKKRVD
jgi:hypothetical protein